MIHITQNQKAHLLTMLDERNVSAKTREEVARLATDRSCNTCALQSARLCHGFGAQRIPDDFFNVGCSSYIDPGWIPF